MTKETPLLIKGSDTTITDQPTDRPTDTAGYRCFGAPKKKTKERKRSKEPREMFENKTRSFRLGEGKKRAVVTARYIRNANIVVVMRKAR